MFSGLAARSHMTAELVVAYRQHSKTNISDNYYDRCSMLGYLWVLMRMNVSDRCVHSTSPFLQGLRLESVRLVYGSSRSCPDYNRVSRWVRC